MHTYKKNISSTSCIILARLSKVHPQNHNVHTAPITTNHSPKSMKVIFSSLVPFPIFSGNPRYHTKIHKISPVYDGNVCVIQKIAAKASISSMSVSYIPNLLMTNPTIHMVTRRRISNHQGVYHKQVGVLTKYYKCVKHTCLGA